MFVFGDGKIEMESGIADQDQPTNGIIRALLNARAPDASICPSEVARLARVGIASRDRCKQLCRTSGRCWRFGGLT